MVLNDEVDLETQKLLTTIHHKVKSENNLWGSRMDVAYLSKEAIRTFKEKPSRVIVSNDSNDSNENVGLEIVDAPKYY